MRMNTEIAGWKWEKMRVAQSLKRQVGFRKVKWLIIEIESLKGWKNGGDRSLDEVNIYEILGVRVDDIDLIDLIETIKRISD